MTTFAVDADIIAYKIAAVNEEHFEGSCREMIDTTLRTIATDTCTTDMRLYLTGKDNFRYKAATTKPYKGNRATIVKPQYLDYCKSYLRSEYGALVVNGYEADDAIATDMKTNGAYHCGVDKDLLQCAGRHYNYVKKIWVTVSKEMATMLLYRQVLMGDKADDIPGLPGVGVKTAEKVIDSAGSAFADARRYYDEVCEKKEMGVDVGEYFSEQYTLIKMVDNIDLYDLITTKVKRRFF